MEISELVERDVEAAAALLAARHRRDRRREPALPGGEPAGFASFYPAEPGLHVPAGAVELDAAVTAPACRGRGVGLALADRGLRATRGEGASACITDWRVPNLLASRFWPRRGFRLTALRLHRVIDAGLPAPA